MLNTRCSVATLTRVSTMHCIRCRCLINIAHNVYMPRVAVRLAANNRRTAGITHRIPSSQSAQEAPHKKNRVLTPCRSPNFSSLCERTLVGRVTVQSAVRIFRVALDGQARVDSTSNSISSLDVLFCIQVIVDIGGHLGLNFCTQVFAYACIPWRKRHQSLRGHVKVTLWIERQNGYCISIVKGVRSPSVPY